MTPDVKGMTVEELRKEARDAQATMMGQLADRHPYEKHYQQHLVAFNELCRRAALAETAGAGDSSADVTNLRRVAEFLVEAGQSLAEESPDSPPTVLGFHAATLLDVARRLEARAALPPAGEPSAPARDAVARAIYEARLGEGSWDAAFIASNKNRSLAYREADAVLALLAALPPAAEPPQPVIPAEAVHEAGFYNDDADWFECTPDDPRVSELRIDPHAVTIAPRETRTEDGE